MDAGGRAVSGTKAEESSGLLHTFPPGGNDHMGYPCKRYQRNPPDTLARLPRRLVPNAALPLSFHLNGPAVSVATPSSIRMDMLSG